jgi:hypothetical protein
MGDEIRITVIATGFEEAGKKKHGLSNLAPSARIAAEILPFRLSSAKASPER